MRHTHTPEATLFPATHTYLQRGPWQPLTPPRPLAPEANSSVNARHSLTDSTSSTQEVWECVPKVFQSCWLVGVCSEPVFLPHPSQGERADNAGSESLEHISACRGGSCMAGVSPSTRVQY